MRTKPLAAQRWRQSNGAKGRQASALLWAVGLPTLLPQQGCSPASYGSGRRLLLARWHGALAPSPYSDYYRCFAHQLSSGYSS